jgi:hypothetical protein
LCSALCVSTASGSQWPPPPGSFCLPSCQKATEEFVYNRALRRSVAHLSVCSGRKNAGCFESQPVGVARQECLVSCSCRASTVCPRLLWAARSNSICVSRWCQVELLKRTMERLRLPDGTDAASPDHDFIRGSIRLAIVYNSPGPPEFDEALGGSLSAHPSASQQDREATILQVVDCRHLGEFVVQVPRVEE